MENLILVATQVGVLFALMAVGFGCRKTKLLDDRGIKGLVDILVVVVTPAIVVQAFQREFDLAMLKGLGFMTAAAILGHIIAILCAGILLHHQKLSTRNVLRVSAVFSNSGFMGIPLTQALLGERGVFYSVVYVAVFNVIIWSWGMCTIRNIRLKEMTRAELRSMFINPGTVGLMLGLPLFFSSTILPQVAAKSVSFLADLNTPLAMIVIGFYLAGAKLKPIAKLGGAYLAVCYRLIVYPLMILGALMIFRTFLNLDRSMMIALVVSAAAPTAALTAMFAARYESDVDTSVGIVSASTLLSIVSMPPVIALALTLL